jgi:hypothetical protein
LYGKRLIQQPNRAVERRWTQVHVLPMPMTWRFDHSLPGDLFAQFAAAVA